MDKDTQKTMTNETDGQNLSSFSQTTELSGQSVEDDFAYETKRSDDWSRSKYGPLDKPEKSLKTPVVVSLSILFIFVVFLCVVIAVNLSSNVQLIGSKKDQTYKTEDGSDPWEEIFGKKEKKDKPADEQPSFPFPKSEDGKDNAGEEEKLPSDSDISDSFSERHKNHPRSEFTGDYYLDFVDSIDYDVFYQIHFEHEQFVSDDQKLVIETSYVQMEGEIPNLSKINKQIQDLSQSVAEYYRVYGYVDESMYQNGVARWYVDTYVTYNDAQMISICLDAGGTIFGMTVNLVTGTIVDNMQVLNFTPAFAREFRTRSNKQNGVSTVLNELSDEALCELFRSKESLILFYTPIGLEVGVNYRTSDYSGWITISMKDYAKYANGV